MLENNDAVLPVVFTPKFIPQWRGPVEGYAVNQINKLLPRVRQSHDFDDLFQTAFEVYLFCKQRYTRVDNGAWFMSLYKRCLFSRFAEELADSLAWKAAVAEELAAEQSEPCCGVLLITLSRAGEAFQGAVRKMLEGTSNRMVPEMRLIVSHGLSSLVLKKRQTKGAK